MRNSEISNKVYHAGFWPRFAAGMIDGLIILLGILIVASVMKFFSVNIFQKFAWLISILIAWSYFIYLTHKYQATVGKMIFSLYVSSTSGGKATLKKVIFRETVGKLISVAAFLTGYASIIFTEKKQGYHDKIADTVVMRAKTREQYSKWGIGLACVSTVLFSIGIAGTIWTKMDENKKMKQASGDDEQARVSVGVFISDAIAYYANNKSSFSRYMPSDKVRFSDCSGEPLINISKDGYKTIIFARSCSQEGKYFCAAINMTKAGVPLVGQPTLVDATLARDDNFSCTVK
jgi:uncharacterized RDD family membrane protein YckC